MIYRDEIHRKALHLASAALPLFYWATNRSTALCLVIPLAALAIVTEGLRHGAPRVRAWLERRFGNLFRKDESRALTGATYVVLANLAAIVLFPARVAVAALLILSISDALASLVGRRFGRGRLFGKSVAGSASFLVSAAAIALVVLPSTPLAAAGGSLAATLIELLPLRLGRFRLDDNLTIPLVGGAAMWALGG